MWKERGGKDHKNAVILQIMTYRHISRHCGKKVWECLAQDFPLKEGESSRKKLNLRKKEGNGIWKKKFKLHKTRRNRTKKAIQFHASSAAREKDFGKKDQR